MSAWNRNSFCIDISEQFIFVGTNSGQIEVVDVDTFSVMNSVQAHDGLIETMAGHSYHKLIAAYGKDGWVSIWSYNDAGQLTKIQDIQTRYFSPPDNEPPFKSTSQALCWHKTKKRLAGHSGNSGVFEIDISDQSYNLLHCSRIFKNLDVITTQYVENSDQLLVASIRGHAALTDGGKVIKEWDFGKGNRNQALHWFEHLSDGNYLIASDGQRIIRFSITDTEPVTQGPLVAKDHLEHVTLNRKERRAFCSSFDRNIYEIDPDTCESLGTIWKAPFKCRWIKTLERDPSLMIVNCRNGGLYKVNINDGKSIGIIKDTPDALWSGIILQNNFILAGEGDYWRLLEATGSDFNQRSTTFLSKKIQFEADSKYYTKRVISVGEDGQVLLGRSDGSLVLSKPENSTTLCKLPAAVRDLVYSQSRKAVYVACEDSHVYKVDISLGTATSIQQFEMPVWAVALNEDDTTLAVGTRMNFVYFLNLSEHKIEKVSTECRFIKRLKWYDSNRLFVASSGSLRQLNQKAQSSLTLVAKVSNTMEDFDWDINSRYIVAISYSRDIYLFDFASGKRLDIHGDSMDYSKGILFLKKDTALSGYRTDFITFGRSGRINLFRVHDERIISLGPVAIT
ncbi:MAG TPA: hypothetical protein PKC21_08885 [Oligoflexia bacterium]|nr:hypothetical protein [Oligoflexia bacterium]HMR25454.1 hypothetical protein [Oligoflexia bacterium]